MMFDSRRQDLFSLCELTSEVFLSLGWGVVSRVAGVAFLGQLSLVNVGMVQQFLD